MIKKSFKNKSIKSSKVRREISSMEIRKQGGDKKKIEKEQNCENEFCITVYYIIMVNTIVLQFTRNYNRNSDKNNTSYN